MISYKYTQLLVRYILFIDQIQTQYIAQTFFNFKHALYNIFSYYAWESFLLLYPEVAIDIQASYPKFMINHKKNRSQRILYTYRMLSKLFYAAQPG